MWCCQRLMYMVCTVAKHGAMRCRIAVSVTAAAAAVAAPNLRALLLGIWLLLPTASSCCRAFCCYGRHHSIGLSCSSSCTCASGTDACVLSPFVRLKLVHVVCGVSVLVTNKVDDMPLVVPAPSHHSQFVVKRLCAPLDQCALPVWLTTALPVPPFCGSISQACAAHLQVWALWQCLCVPCVLSSCDMLHIAS